MARQRRPTGTFRTASVEWKRRVIARMQELGISRAELARLAKVSDAAITQLLGREGGELKASSCKFMPQIHRALRWDVPQDAAPPPTDDDLRSKFLRVWNDLDETERAVIKVFVDKRAKQPS